MHAFIKNVGLISSISHRHQNPGSSFSNLLLHALVGGIFFSLQRTYKYISACEFYLNNPVRHLPSDDMTLDINEYNLSSMIFYSWEIKR